MPHENITERTTGTQSPARPAQRPALYATGLAGSVTSALRPCATTWDRRLAGAPSPRTALRINTPARPPPHTHVGPGGGVKRW